MVHPSFYESLTSDNAPEIEPIIDQMFRTTLDTASRQPFFNNNVT